MTSDDLLEHTRRAVRDRRQAYGDPERFFAQVAERWPQVVGARLTPQQIVLCLLDLKLARLAHSPSHLDSLIDLIGYAICLEELRR